VPNILRRFALGVAVTLFFGLSGNIAVDAQTAIGGPTGDTQSDSSTTFPRSEPESTATTPTRSTATTTTTTMATTPSTTSILLRTLQLSKLNIAWRVSTSIGRYTRGRLVNGVVMPEEGPDHITWDPGTKTTRSPSFRRNGTDRLIHNTLCVIAQYRLENRESPRILIGDISLPNGGAFGPEFGGLGHSSHQVGLDVYYPRRDQQETEAATIDQIDLPGAQDLVDRFVAAGATNIFVGRRTGLRGPSDIVQYVAKHDNHLHVRWPFPLSSATVTNTSRSSVSPSSVAAVSTSTTTTTVATMANTKPANFDIC
jgi:murein endopeptidase